MTQADIPVPRTARPTDHFVPLWQSTLDDVPEILVPMGMGRENLDRSDRFRNGPLALSGVAVWVRKSISEVLPDNCIVTMPYTRACTHDQLRMCADGSIPYDDGAVYGFFTYSGFFVPRSIAMWCSKWIVGGLTSQWEKQSAFAELQSPGVVWQAHEKAWKGYQEDLAKKQAEEQNRVTST